MLCMLSPSLDGGLSWHIISRQLLTPKQVDMPSSIHLERLLGIGAVLLGLIAIVACIVAGWYLAWASSLRDIQFFQELLGGAARRQHKSKPTAAELQAEIARIKAEHRRGHSSPGRSSGLYPRSERRPSRVEDGRPRRSESRHSGDARGGEFRTRRHSCPADSMSPRPMQE